MELGQYGLREVMYTQVINLENSTPLIYLDFVNSVSLQNGADTVYATGGRGGPRVLTFNGAKTATLTISSQIFTLSSIAVMTGSEIIKGQTDIYEVENGQVKNVAGDLIITLGKTPSDVLPAVFKFVNGVITTPVGVLGVNGNEIELDPLTVSAGEEVQVFYQWQTTNDTYTIQVDAGKFPPYTKLVVEAFFTDRFANKVVDGQFNIFKAKAQPTFTLSGANSGDPTTIEMVFDILSTQLPDGRQAMYDLTIYDN